MSTTRTFTVVQDEVEVKALGVQRLTFGKTVLGSDGQQHMTVAWIAQKPGPEIDISWDVRYALNWTESLPPTGVKVTYKGVWQECALGDSYDLNSDGFWATSTGAGVPNFLCVGANNYDGNVHIIVGLYDPTTSAFRPIFVDTRNLLLGAKATYQPQEEAAVWYASDVVTSSMISEITTHRGEANTSSANIKTNSFVWTGSYDPFTGKWSGDYIDIPPTAAKFTGPFKEYVVTLFKKAIKPSVQTQVKADVEVALKKTYAWARVEFQTELIFKVIVGPKKPKEGLGAEEDDVRAAVKYAQVLGHIPSEDEYTVQPVSGADEIEVDRAGASVPVA